jgi:hypothetical protein
MFKNVTLLRKVPRLISPQISIYISVKIHMYAVAIKELNTFNILYKPKYY